MAKQTKFILAIALQIVIIFTIIIFKLAILSGGTDVLLRIQPVDPHDVLRGDYITFKYSSISDINSYMYDGKQIKDGDSVYVILRKDGEYWTAVNIQETRPSDSNVYIKGKVVSGGIQNNPGIYQGQQFGNSNLHVVYGIEQYFIPEGKGRGFSFWNKKAAAMVVIDKNGNSVIKQIYVNEKPWP